MSAPTARNLGSFPSPLPTVLLVEPDTTLAAERICPLFTPCARTVQATTLDEVRGFCRSSTTLALALVELDLPGLPTPGVWNDHAGFEAVDLLTRTFPSAKVCILSRHISVAYINRAHVLGATYISKLGGIENLRQLARWIAGGLA